MKEPRGRDVDKREDVARAMQRERYQREGCRTGYADEKWDESTAERERWRMSADIAITLLAPLPNSIPAKGEEVGNDGYEAMSRKAATVALSCAMARVDYEAAAREFRSRHFHPQPGSGPLTDADREDARAIVDSALRGKS